MEHYVHTSSLPYNSSSMQTSLPALPHINTPPLERKRWGEDDVTERHFQVTKSGLARFRNSIDSCHPVPDVFTPSTYEGYMYPKPLQQNISALQGTRASTSRHVPRDSTCELFPTHDPNRLQNNGRYVLSDPTRQALAVYAKQLFRTSRYSQMYEDTSDFMACRLDRDTQYDEECADCDKPSTCVRVFNHSDPCPHCWTGGFNKDFDSKLKHFQSLLQDRTKCDTKLSNGEIPQPCSNSEKCPHKNNLLKPIPKQDWSKPTIDSVFCKCTPPLEGSSNCGGKCDIVSSRPGVINCQRTEHETENNRATEYCNQSPAQMLGSELFGPWSDSFQSSKKDDRLFLPHVYNYKLSSSVHCWPMENEYASTLHELHASCQCYPVSDNYFGPWPMLSRSKMDDENMNQTALVEETDQSNSCMAEDRNTIRNSWTFRDENNLRIPCIPHVIGNTHKTDVHKRFHADHPEPIPDLRDFRKYARRFKFFGYNSSVFR